MAYVHVACNKIRTLKIWTLFNSFRTHCGQTFRKVNLRLQNDLDLTKKDFTPIQLQENVTNSDKQLLMKIEVLGGHGQNLQ